MIAFRDRAVYDPDQRLSTRNRVVGNNADVEGHRTEGDKGKSRSISKFDEGRF